MTNHRLPIILVIILLTLPQLGWATDWPTFNLLKADSSVVSQIWGAAVCIH